MNRYLFRLLSFKKKIQLVLLNKYSELENQFVISLLNSLNKMARNAIIAEGKNPDYVVPVPAPTVQDAMKPMKSFNFVSAPCSWVKKTSDHPVLKSRAVFAAKQSEPSPENISLPDNFDFEKFAISLTEESDPVEITSVTRPVKQKVVSKKKTSKKLVGKNKKGSFRRV